MQHDLAAESKTENGGTHARGPRPWTAQERGQVRRVVVAVVVLALFFCFQMTGAVLARSDVLRAEALHILTDVAALGLALLAMHAARHEVAGRFSYGLRRAEPIAALVNALFVLGATALLVTNAIDDLRTGATPDADIMLWVAICAVIINGASAWLIHGAIDPMHQHGHGVLHVHVPAPHDSDADDHLCEQGHVYVPGHELHEGHALNLRGAFLHLAGDAMGSTAAVAAALLVRLGISPKADPIAAFVVAGILVYAAARLVRDAVRALVDIAGFEAAQARVSHGHETDENHDESRRDT
jgi:cobalt-zinc-cadmium efflux system protein